MIVFMGIVLRTTRLRSRLYFFQHAKVLLSVSGTSVRVVYGTTSYCGRWLFEGRMSCAVEQCDIPQDVQSCYLSCVKFDSVTLLSLLCCGPSKWNSEPTVGKFLCARETLSLPLVCVTLPGPPFLL